MGISNWFVILVLLAVYLEFRKKAYAEPHFLKAFLQIDHHMDHKKNNLTVTFPIDMPSAF
jgi:hypothetical protein